MSETTTQDPPEPAQETDPAATTVDADAKAEGDQEGQPAAPEADKPDPAQQKISQRAAHLTRLANEHKRRADIAEAELAKARELLAARDGDGKVADPPRGQTTHEQIRAEAEKLVAEQQIAVDRGKIIKAGVAEFGAEMWNEKTEMITTMGALAKPEFMEALAADSDVAHKVIVALADDPDQLVSLLAMRPAAMAARMGRLAAEMNVDKPKTELSKTPPPGRPVGGRGLAPFREPAPGSKEWFAWRNQTAPKHLGGQGKAA